MAVQIFEVKIAKYSACKFCNSLQFCSAAVSSADQPGCLDSIPIESSNSMGVHGVQLTPSDLMGVHGVRPVYRCTWCLIESTRLHQCAWSPTDSILGSVFATRMGRAQHICTNHSCKYAIFTPFVLQRDWGPLQMLHIGKKLSYIMF